MLKIKECINDSLVAKDYFDFKHLTKCDKNLLPVKVINDGDKLFFEYELSDNEICFDTIRKSSSESKYKSLINVAELFKLCGEYEFSINPTNLFVTTNNIVKVKSRDLISVNSNFENEFLNYYKSLVIWVLFSKSDFENIYNNLDFEIKKSKQAQKLVNVNSVSEIVDNLRSEYSSVVENKNNEISQVSKSKFALLKVLFVTSILSSVVLFVLSIFFGWFSLNQEYKNNDIADSFYNKDYSFVMLTLKNSDTNSLDNTTKYIYAVSSIKNQNLTPKQKNQFLNQVSLNSNSDVLSFWDLIAQEKYDQGQKVALKLKDSSLVNVVNSLRKGSSYER